MSVTIKHNGIASRRSVPRLQRRRAKAIVTHTKLIVVTINITTMLTNDNPSKCLPIVQFYLYFSRLLVAILIEISFRLSAVYFFVLRRYTTFRDSTPVALVARIIIRSTRCNLAHSLAANLVTLLPVVHCGGGSVISQEVALPANTFRIILGRFHPNCHTISRYRFLDRNNLDKLTSRPRQIDISPRIGQLAHLDFVEYRLTPDGEIGQKGMILPILLLFY